jgi:hypothetical protein
LINKYGEGRRGLDDEAAVSLYSWQSQLRETEPDIKRMIEEYIAEF